jgi:hypothetical protein
MTDSELYAAAYKMQREGGHFASAIAAAFFVADASNRAILIDAFYFLFNRYSEPKVHHETNS